MLDPCSEEGSCIPLGLDRDEFESLVIKSLRSYVLGLKMSSFSFLLVLFLGLRLYLFVWLINIKIIMKHNTCIYELVLYFISGNIFVPECFMWFICKNKYRASL